MDLFLLDALTQPQFASFAELLKRRYAGEDAEFEEEESEEAPSTAGLEAPSSPVPSEMSTNRQD